MTTLLPLFSLLKPRQRRSGSRKAHRANPEFRTRPDGQVYPLRNTGNYDESVGDRPHGRHYQDEAWRRLRGRREARHAPPGRRR